MDGGRPATPRPRARTACPALRPERRLCPGRDDPGGGRRGRDDPAGQRWERETRADGSWRSGPNHSGRRSSPSWASGSPRPRTARSSASSASPAGHPARPPPARRPRRPGTRAGAVESLTYETHPAMALAVMGEIADEIVTRFGVVPARDRAPRRRGAARRAIGRDRRLRGAPRRGLRGRPLRDRRDEGPGTDLEGRAI